MIITKKIVILQRETKTTFYNKKKSKYDETTFTLIVHICEPYARSYGTDNVDSACN